MDTTAKLLTFNWEGTNKRGHKLSGEINAANSIAVKTELRRQGIIPKKVKKKSRPLFSSDGKKITSADITHFTRQLATMLDAGIPLVQSLDILGKGNSNPNMQKLIISIKNEVESGTPFSKALAKTPKHFNELFCNLVNTGEESGTLDGMLARVATYKEKTESLKSKIKKAMFYPAAVIIVALLITAGLLIFVVPQFESVFQNFGADLPLPTRVVISMSEFFQAYWWIIFSAIGLAGWGIVVAKRRSEKFAYNIDKYSLRLPVVGAILQKAAVARFARTLSTTFAAGLPLVDALKTVSGAAGNQLYKDAVLMIRESVSVGQKIQFAMNSTQLFPSMVVQMISIGEEAGSLEFMLSKVADFYEEQVDDAVEGLSSLLEPLIMVILGVLIGGLVVAMYMPIFKLGSVV